MAVRALKIFVLFTTGSLFCCGVDDTIRYPSTRRSDHVDVYHGVEVADPYRWLEEDVRDSEEVAEWVRRQNEVTQSYLSAIPERAEIEVRVRELWEDLERLC